MRGYGKASLAWFRFFFCLWFFVKFLAPSWFWLEYLVYSLNNYHGCCWGSAQILLSTHTKAFLMAFHLRRLVPWLPACLLMPEMTQEIPNFCIFPAEPTRKLPFCSHGFQILDQTLGYHGYSHKYGSIMRFQATHYSSWWTWGKKPGVFKEIKNIPAW